MEEHDNHEENVLNDLPSSVIFWCQLGEKHHPWYLGQPCLNEVAFFSKTQDKGKNWGLFQREIRV